MSNKVATVRSIPSNQAGSNGDMVIFDDRRGSMFLCVKSNNRWWKISDLTLPTAGQNSKNVLKPSKGIFSTIELTGRPENENELGNIKGNITTKRGIAGDVTVQLNYRAKVTSTTNWVFANGDRAINSGATGTSVGDTVAIGVTGYGVVGAIMPYDVTVECISSLWSDSIGLSGSGTQYFGVWTTPGGSTAVTQNTGSGTATYTLRYMISKTGTIAASSANHRVELKSSASFDLNAGDWIVIGSRNTAASSTVMHNAASTLYCKLR